MEKAWTFKNYWAKEALNIMYRAISIWGLGPSLKNVWLEGIPGKNRNSTCQTARH